MNRIVAIDRARTEVAAIREHCRASYDRGGGIDMLHLLCSCWDFHQWCQQLREAEEKLRLLELRGEPANDTGIPDVFDMNYPRATRTGDLLHALEQALPAIDWQRLKVDVLYAWSPGSDVFFATARWAQIENAHRSHQLRLPTPGMTIPERQPMPLGLAQALTIPAKTKAKRASKKGAA